jgi:hypothetical protein
MSKRLKANNCSKMAPKLKNDPIKENYVVKVNPLTPFDYLKAKKFSGGKTAQK